MDTSWPPGVRFRRQHCCFLAIVILIIVLCITIGLTVTDSAEATSEEATVHVVRQILTEVPLVDG